MPRFCTYINLPTMHTVSFCFFTHYKIVCVMLQTGELYYHLLLYVYATDKIHILSVIASRCCVQYSYVAKYFGVINVHNKLKV